MQIDASDQRASLLVDLFDNTSDLIQLIDIEGRIELVNRAWCQTLGFSEEEAIGRNVFSLIAPDCQEHCQLLFRDLLCQGGRQRIECAFIARNGQRIDLDGQLDVATIDGRPMRVRSILRDVTARRTAERALQNLNDSLERRIEESTAALLASEARLKEAQALAHTGHWEIELATGSQHWSEEAYRICGLDPARVTPSFETFLEQVHPEDRELLLTAMDRIADLRKPLEMQYRLLLEGGEVRHLQARMMTHTDEQGRPQRVIGTSHDVTGMIESQRLLHESEQKFRSLFELSPLGIALISRDGHLIQANRAFQKLFGMEPGCKESLNLPAETVEAIDRINSSSLTGEPLSQSAQMELVRLDGSRFPAEILTQRLPRAEGTSDGEGLLWLIAEDISGRREAEQSLRQAANVFRYAQEGIMITEPDGRVVDVNEAFTRMTGYTPQEIVGCTPRLLSSGRHDSAFYAGMLQKLTAEGRWSGEVINRAKNGELQEMLETISAVQDENGNVTHYVALLTDIRQIKQQQYLLEKLAHFDQLTGLANRTLLSTRLQQAMDEVKGSDEVIAVCYLDLDGFKEVNDTFGHTAGDKLLKIVSTRMSRILRGSDMLARLGGDEFVAVLRDARDSTAIRPALDRLLAALKQPVCTEGQTMEITASIGVSLYPSLGGPMGADQVLRLADQAMYNAKRVGKNRYAFETEASHVGSDPAPDERIASLPI